MSSQDPKETGSGVTINDGVAVAIKTPKDENEKKEDASRKYRFGNIFRNFMCCSCFTTDRSQKYKVNNGDYDEQQKKGNVDKFKNNGGKNGNNISPKFAVTQRKSNSALPTDASSNETFGVTTTQTNVVCVEGGQEEETSLLADCSRPMNESFENEQLLPDVTEGNRHKKCFIIDLDETLVHSSFKFVKTADISVKVDIDGTQHEVFVCKRPFVDEFLKELGDLYECVLFTASLGKYADPVTDFLDKDSIFASRLFREACSFREGNYVKDLGNLGRDVNSIVILDNSPVSYLLHPQNAVQIVSWFDDLQDTALRDLIPYFKLLAESPLPVPEWLESNPPPESAGILGYPPSNLHWILMQTLSVPEAIAIYQQRLRESYHPSGSSNVSRQSSTRGNGDHHGGTANPDWNILHHALITQASKGNRRKSLALQEDESYRPSVSSPVARMSTELHLTDEFYDNDELNVEDEQNNREDTDETMNNTVDEDNNERKESPSCELSNSVFVYHHSSDAVVEQS